MRLFVAVFVGLALVSTSLQAENIRPPGGGKSGSGGLTQAEILAVIRSNLNQIRKCYEELLVRLPGASGKMSSHFIVGPEGKVTISKIQGSTIEDDKMKSCVVKHIAKWKFPAPRGGKDVTVNYPFVFNPDK